MKWLRDLLGKSEPAPAISATLRKEPGNVHVLRISGMINKATLDNIQAAAARDIAAGASNLRILVILDDFRGWKRGDDWGDLAFFSQYEQQIARIAVLCDPRWEAETKLFLGAGRRTGEVRCFAPDQETAARNWLKS